MLELHFAKENLLPDTENEWLPTVNAGQGFVTVLHATHFLARRTIFLKGVRCTSRTPGCVGGTSSVPGLLSCPARQ
jgi:hypothetical protein